MGSHLGEFRIEMPGSSAAERNQAMQDLRIQVAGAARPEDAVMKFEKTDPTTMDAVQVLSVVFSSQVIPAIVAAISTYLVTRNTQVRIVARMAKGRTIEMSGRGQEAVRQLAAIVKELNGGTES
jgi:hypothetical protein